MLGKLSSISLAHSYNLVVTEAKGWEWYYWNLKVSFCSTNIISVFSIIIVWFIWCNLYRLVEYVVHWALKCHFESWIPKHFICISCLYQRRQKADYLKVFWNLHVQHASPKHSSKSDISVKFLSHTSLSVDPSKNIQLEFWCFITYLTCFIFEKLNTKAAILEFPQALLKMKSWSWHPSRLCEFTYWTLPVPWYHLWCLCYILCTFYIEN